MLKKYCINGPHLNAAWAAYRCRHTLIQIPIFQRPTKNAKASVDTLDDSVDGKITREVMYAGMTTRQYNVRFPSMAAKII